MVIRHASSFTEAQEIWEKRAESSVPFVIFLNGTVYAEYAPAKENQLAIQ